MSKSLVVSMECRDFRCGNHIGEPSECIPILNIDLRSVLSFKKNFPSFILFFIDFSNSLYAGLEYVFVPKKRKKIIYLRN